MSAAASQELPWNFISLIAERPIYKHVETEIQISSGISQKLVCKKNRSKWKAK